MGLIKFISPSIMVPKIYEYKEYMKQFDKYDLSVIHFDVMDGHFVPNIMLGTSVFNDLKQMTQIPIDIHLMVNEPEKYISMFDTRKDDWIGFHPETTNQSYRLLQTIKDMGCRAGLVISPGTPISYLEECVDQLDYVTLMTVNPGFAGQTLVPNSFDKLKRIRQLLDSYNPDIDLLVDGNTTLENSKKMSESGANGFVVGSASKILKDPSTFGKYYDDFMHVLG
ncbi:ribulose-phosphate 3-epimerase [Enterococcus hulanensis]|uniref:Ribulose-phosphate 3-epimerase n=1 Tax=Enterococcus hulanensis TaxID=2559929 RepID=A0ABU3F338_9ENTE|nr:ribulose-phosphate 3-epimerase [Enterococcus hulanensis]MDT2601530.1 ribulose-phosphate 3-epimerase [Enterococcus hulanensis]MDT2610927.1 ribulose-phosphate 3-epimerase [Enterococcus hulanensis]MDT2618332.1 ribulose-phosphate 3-epimerase [Enterococcus hulanensis]MDT2629465.1 ribulose-phosphate 3-epimerase [Enterococcus hulanensis]MDT2657027.1 ribulose-phosphate 3-epimerase [Enterococcus hulanensis]